MVVRLTFLRIPGEEYGDHTIPARNHKELFAANETYRRVLCCLLVAYAAGGEFFGETPACKGTMPFYDEDFKQHIGLELIPMFANAMAVMRATFKHGSQCMEGGTFQKDSMFYMSTGYLCQLAHLHTLHA